MLPINSTQLVALFCSLFLIGSAEVVAGPMMVFMGEHFGVPSAEIAYLPAAYGLAYAVVAIFFGPFSDRFGRKYPLQLGLLGFALFGALIPNAVNLIAAIVLSAMMGVSAAVIQPNALSMVGDKAPAGKSGQLIGRVCIGLMLGFVLTPAFAGLVADTIGWQTAYYGLSVIAIMVLLVVSRAFPNQLIIEGHPDKFWATHYGAISTKGAFRKLAASYLWLGGVAGFGAVVAEVCVRKLSLSPTDAGMVAGFYGMVVIVGNLSSTQLHRLLGSAALPVIAMTSAIGVAAFLLPVNSLFQLAIAGIPWAFGYGCAGPLHQAQLSGLSDRYRGTINSYHASLLNMGIFSVSLLMGTLASTVSSAIFCMTVSFMCVLGAALLIDPLNLKLQMKSTPP